MAAYGAALAPRGPLSAVNGAALATKRDSIAGLCRLPVCVQPHGIVRVADRFRLVGAFIDAPANNWALTNKDQVHVAWRLA
jgi:hypothetical protein